MNNDLVKNLVRITLIVLIQVLILRRLNLSIGSFNYIHILFYPVLIMILPLRISKPLLLIIGFVIGLVVDVFYDSLGVHASACVFLAYIRPYVLSVFEPRGGFSVNTSPTKHNLGMYWFLRYAAAMLLLHLLFYFSMEVFTVVYLKEIILRTIFSFIFSFAFIMLYKLLFNPK